MNEAVDMMYDNVGIFLGHLNFLLYQSMVHAL